MWACTDISQSPLGCHFVKGMSCARIEHTVNVRWKQLLLCLSESAINCQVELTEMAVTRHRSFVETRCSHRDAVPFFSFKLLKIHEKFYNLYWIFLQSHGDSRNFKYRNYYVGTKTWCYRTYIRQEYFHARLPLMT